MSAQSSWPVNSEMPEDAHVSGVKRPRRWRIGLLLGIGVLISTVSQNQGQAIQLAVMTMLPQVLLSGLIFPLASIAAGVRWLSYLLPLTYFNEIARGVMLRAEPIGPLWRPFVFLALLGLVVVTLAILRFRGYLAPAPAGGGPRLRHRRGKQATAGVIGQGEGQPA